MLRSGRPIRLAVQIQPQHARYAQIRDVTLRLEDMGVDAITTWDHFFPLTGDPDGNHFECWTMLAAIAEQTERVEFGALVSAATFRNPHLLADMARTIDHISAKNGKLGRLILGIGAGWFERDFLEYGYAFGSPGQRLDTLERNLAVIEDRWSKLSPPPTRKIPILIGGSGERKTLRIVARHADIWNTSSDANGLIHKLDVLRKWGDEVGRDTDSIEISVDLRDRTVADADRLHELGATLMTINVHAPDFGTELVAHWLAWRDRANRA